MIIVVLQCSITHQSLWQPEGYPMIQSAGHLSSFTDDVDLYEMI